MLQGRDGQRKGLKWTACLLLLMLLLRLLPLLFITLVQRENGNTKVKLLFASAKQYLALVTFYLFPITSNFKKEKIHTKTKSKNFHIPCIGVLWHFLVLAGVQTGVVEIADVRLH